MFCITSWSWGLIPARAGKTCRGISAVVIVWAHPRAGGENVVPKIKQAAAVGSSPRGRGKLGEEELHGVCVRLIPARAGKTKHTPCLRE